MSDEVKKGQIKAIAAVIVGIVPPAAKIAFPWAEKMYEHGLRIHPELAQHGPVPTEAQKQWTPAVQEAAEERALKLLREMAKQFPYLQPMMDEFEAATTPEEKAALAIKLRENIQPEVLAAARAKFVELGDNTE